MAGDLRVLSRSLKHYKPTTSILPENSLSLQSNQWIHQTRHTLILESAPSHSVTFHRLSDSYSGIIEVRFERPEVRNAIGRDMQRRLQSAFEAVSEDSSANVLLIRNNVSKVFCAGADLKVGILIMFFVQIDVFLFFQGTCTRYPKNSSNLCSLYRNYGFNFQSGAVISIHNLLPCFFLLDSCTNIVEGEDAVMGLPETGLAIIPGAGGTQRLPRLVRKAISEELIFTGRKIGGREAMSIGLVNYRVPAGEAHLKAIEVARNINEKGPIAIRVAKKAVDEGVEVDKTSALALEEQCYEQTLNTNDRLEALAAFSEKRKPKYKGAEDDKLGLICLG
nr:probable enoyl-CoA hydratase 2, mitochondrial [Malus domestica]